MPFAKDILRETQLYSYSLHRLLGLPFQSAQRKAVSRRSSVNIIHSTNFIRLLVGIFYGQTSSLAQRLPLTGTFNRVNVSRKCKLERGCNEEAFQTDYTDVQKVVHVLTRFTLCVLLIAEIVFLWAVIRSSLILMINAGRSLKKYLVYIKLAGAIQRHLYHKMGRLQTNEFQLHLFLSLIFFICRIFLNRSRGFFYF